MNRHWLLYGLIFMAMLFASNGQPRGRTSTSRRNNCDPDAEEPCAIGTCQCTDASGPLSRSLCICSQTEMEGTDTDTEAEDTDTDEEDNTCTVMDRSCNDGYTCLCRRGGFGRRGAAGGSTSATCQCVPEQAGNAMVLDWNSPSVVFLAGLLVVLLTLNLVVMCYVNVCGANNKRVRYQKVKIVDSDSDVIDAQPMNV